MHAAPAPSQNGTAPDRRDRIFRSRESTEANSSAAATFVAAFTLDSPWQPHTTSFAAVVTFDVPSIVVDGEAESTDCAIRRHPPSPMDVNGEAVPLVESTDCDMRRTSPSPMDVNGEPAAELSLKKPKLHRDARGRFQKGHKFAGGNPFYRRLAAMRRTVAEAVTHKEMHQLVRKLYTEATQGDRAAAKLLMAYGIGCPEKVVDPDAVDVDEWRRFQQLPASNAEFERIWHRIPIHNMMDLLKTLWPERVKVFYKGLAGIVNGDRPPEPDLTPLVPAINEPGPVANTI